MAGLFSVLSSVFSGASKAISNTASSASRAITNTASTAARTASSSASNAIKAAAVASRAAAKSAASNPIVKTAAVATGATAASAAVLSSQNNNSSDVVISGLKTALATTPLLMPVSVALNLAGGSNSSILSSSGNSKTTKSTLDFPDFSYSAVLNRISDTWDTGNGSAENAAKFLSEGRDGTATVSERQIIANNLGIGNAGKTLYKTIYDDGSFEIRTSTGGIASSGSAGAGYAKTAEEKAASVNAYQKKNQAEMQAAAAKGDGAAQAWLDKYGSSDSDMYSYAPAAKVWPGQTDSTTKIISRQYVTDSEVSSNTGGDFLSGIMDTIGGFFGGSSTEKEKSNQKEGAVSYTYGILGGTLGTVSGGYDTFYNTKQGMYGSAAESFESGDFAKGAAYTLPALAVDYVIPADLLNVGNKVLSGRADEITIEDLGYAAFDAITTIAIPFTGGTSYVGGKALKTALKASKGVI